MIRDFLCARGIAEISFTSLLVLFILKSSKFHRKTPVLKSLFNKVAGIKPGTSLTFLKKDSNTGVFPVKFTKFLGAPILKNICEPLLLYLQVILFASHEKVTANEAQLEPLKDIL